jgi:ethanolamine utilization protein EutQ (cupin superfamily)
MTTQKVVKPTHDPNNEKAFGTAIIEHRTAQTGLSDLGTYLMSFPDEQHTDPWTLHYEETIYVIDGEARLIVHAEDGTEYSVNGNPGEVIVLRRGSTVQYGASAGTRLLLSIAPVNWRDHGAS